jgi:hypothetical protein
MKANPFIKENQPDKLMYSFFREYLLNLSRSSFYNARSLKIQRRKIDADSGCAQL